MVMFDKKEFKIEVTVIVPEEMKHEDVIMELLETEQMINAKSKVRYHFHMNKPVK